MLCLHLSSTNTLAVDLRLNSAAGDDTTARLTVPQRAPDGFGDADGAPADVSIPTLYDVYLKPWKAYVIAHVEPYRTLGLLTRDDILVLSPVTRQLVVL